MWPQHISINLFQQAIDFKLGLVSLITTETILNTFFDLINFIYEPYQEPNDNPVYINKNSNHAHTVLQQLAKSVSKRISQTSSNEHIFKESGLICEEALKKSEFYQKPEYLRK